jgi:hypothetical protein
MPESFGQPGRRQSPYHNTMIDYDKNAATVLNKLDELKIGTTPSSSTVRIKVRT